ncbi:MAG: hypothetical protein WCO94_13480 [Verrucomicrobiota bacterium]
MKPPFTLFLLALCVASPAFAAEPSSPPAPVSPAEMRRVYETAKAPFIPITPSHRLT